MKRVSPFRMSGRVLSDWRAGRKVGICVRGLFSLPTRGKGRTRQPRRGQAAATASASQLAISSVPPVGAAIGNSPCPAYCRSVRSPANRLAAITKPKAAAMPILDMDDPALGQRDGAQYRGGVKQQHRRRGGQPRRISADAREAAASMTPSAPMTAASTIRMRADAAHQAALLQRGAPSRRAIPACRRRSARMSPALPETRPDVWRARAVVSAMCFSSSAVFTWSALVSTTW